MKIALPAIDLVPSRTSATNPAARTHRPKKRNTKRIMGGNALGRDTGFDYSGRVRRSIARVPGCGSTHPRFHPLRRVLPEIPPPGDLPAPGRHKCWSGPRVELEKPGARLHKTDTPEGWPSGLRRTLGKRVYVKA